MNRSRVSIPVSLVLMIVLAAAPALFSAAVTKADYDRATGLRAKYQALALNIVGGGGWIGKTARYWYVKSVPGGSEYWIVDAAKSGKAIAFDHAKLAAALAAAAGEKVEPLSLPFFRPTFGDDGASIEFMAFGSRWRCDLATYAVEKLELPGPRRGGPGRDLNMWARGPAPEAASAGAKA